MSDFVYQASEIEEALREAIFEHDRSPQTSIWFSFWDRLTQGSGPSPDWTEV